MITQNPIIGRSRKKLAGVYARTLWGKNVLQSLPSPTKVPPTKALNESRAAFGRVTTMANMIPASLLFNICYATPVGRSRRHVVTSQLFTGVVRDGLDISFNLEAISQFGTNPVVTRSGLLFTIPAKAFTIPIADFNATQLADTSLVPCIMAMSYELRVCVPWLPYTEIDGDTLSFSNISDTFLGHEVLLLPLWQVNIGTAQNPIWVYGSFNAEQ